MKRNEVFSPLWPDTLARTPPRWPTLVGEIEADVVVIGAGITGLSTAWHLVNAGLRVVILEAGTVGNGTTGSSTGSDGILDIANPCADTFNPKRFTPAASAKNFLKESAAVSKHLVHDHLTYGRVRECTELAPGQGCVVKVEGEKVAASRDHDGVLHVVSAVCTHLGCLVHWNPRELSWDCPCHGSRFSMEGHVLEGPAQKDLARPGGVATVDQA